MEVAAPNCTKNDNLQTEISDSSYSKFPEHNGTKSIASKNLYHQVQSRIPKTKKKETTMIQSEATKQPPKNYSQTVYGLHRKTSKIGLHTLKQSPRVQNFSTIGSLGKPQIKKDSPRLAKSISKLNVNASKFSPRKLKSTTAVNGIPYQTSEKIKTPRASFTKNATSSLNLTSPTKANVGSSAKERVAEQKANIVFEDLHKKLQNIQTEFMRKVEVVQNGISSKKNVEYKLIAMVKNGKLKLVSKDEEVVGISERKLGNSTKNMDLKTKIDSFIVHNQKMLIESIELTLKDKSIADFGISPAEWQIGISKVVEDLRNTLEKQNSEELQEILQNLELGSSPAKSCVNTEVNDKITKLHNEIEESKNCIQKYENQINNLKKVNEENFGQLEKELAAKNKLLVQKEADLMENQKKLKSIEQESNDKIAIEKSKKDKCLADLKLNKENVSKIRKQVSQLEEELKVEKNHRLHSEEKLKEKDLALFKTMSDLDELRLKESAILSGGDSTSLPSENNEIILLKTTLECLRKEKFCLEKETDDLKIDIAKANGIIQRQIAAENESKELIAELQTKVDDLTEQLVLKEAKIRADIEIEISSLRNSDAEKSREIEKLRFTLSKTQFDIQQLEERVQCDQQLLRVRSELISSLQSNENSHRVHLDELFVQVAEKSNTIGELSTDLRTKKGEFQNLFSTLSSKQLELSRQAHVIKLLEESNDRSQMLRVKQEEKIGRMEEEIASLQHSLSLYQGAVLSSNAARKNVLFASISPPTETSPHSTVEHHNAILYNPTNERYHKRHVEHKVKKYEI